MNCNDMTLTDPTALLHVVFNPVTEYDVQPFHGQKGFGTSIAVLKHNLIWQHLTYIAAFPGSTIRYSLASLSTKWL